MEAYLIGQNYDVTCLTEHFLTEGKVGPFSLEKYVNASFFSRKDKLHAASYAEHFYFQ